MTRACARLVTCWTPPTTWPPTSSSLRSPGRNLAGEPFGEARLADLLVREALAGQPAAETMRRLAHAFLVHQGTSSRDDATLVFLEWPGPSGGLA